MRRAPAFLILAVLAGCGGGPGPEAPPPASEPAANPEPAAEPAAKPPAPGVPDAVLLYDGGSSQAAMICVRKKFGDLWREKKFVVLPRNEEKGHTGDIGKPVQEKNAETGEPVDLDFSTGCILLGIAKEKYSPPGGAPRDRYRLRYLDPRGLEQQLWIRDEPGEQAH
ncbi:MAG: hypothetical protein HYY18_10535 [Planctomycetes bacterium]|nr:hypothetical protein [Planctomycetota bacterium]